MHVIRAIHRWGGIGLCMMFSAWFVSGAVMIYHPFPSLPEKERQTQRPTINLSRIGISPSKAVRVSGIHWPVRLQVVDIKGMPVYLVHDAEGGIIPISADEGKRLGVIDHELAGRIAAAFWDHPVSHIEGPFEYDQWIVHQRFDPYRPFFRVDFQDPDETVLYVSGRTGEVLQKTQWDERAWNYVGAIIHWIYPTALRRHWGLWDQVVWWISLFGVITTVLGLGLGFYRIRVISPIRHVRKMSPYQGWLGAHHLLGLIAGSVVLAWIVSGWLSMDHGRIFSNPSPVPTRVQEFQGIALKDVAAVFSTTSLQALTEVNALEFLGVGGKPLVLANGIHDSHLYEGRKASGLVPTTLTREEIVKAVEKAWSQSRVSRVYKPDNDDSYSQLREGGLPERTLRLVLKDPGQTWVHIDMETGRIVSIMDQSRRIYRWLFNGLHSLDFPGLAGQRPLWDILILGLLGIGLTFSVTGVVLAWKRVWHP